MKRLPILLSVLCLGISPMAVTRALAQDRAPRPYEADGMANPLFAAMKAREALADEVLSDDAKPEAVLDRLRADPSPMGSKLGRETQFAFAAADLGQRVQAGGKPKDAEIFFRAADAALVIAVENLRGRADEHERLLALRKRAHVRARHLGMGAEAKADLEEAARLKPGDRAIARQRDSLLSGYGELNRRPAGPDAN